MTSEQIKQLCRAFFLAGNDVTICPAAKYRRRATALRRNYIKSRPPIL